MMTQAAMMRTNPTPASPARQEPQTPSEPLLFPPVQGLPQARRRLPRRAGPAGTARSTGWRHPLSPGRAAAARRPGQTSDRTDSSDAADWHAARIRPRPDRPGGGPMHTHEVDQHAPHQTPHEVMSITGLRAHPLRMLVVFGTPVAFATTGFLHLVPWPAGSEIEAYTRLRDHATLWIAIHVVQLLLILLLAVAIYWLTEGL